MKTKLFENVGGNQFTLVKGLEPVNEMGKFKDSAKLSPKYKRAKELAIEQWSLGYDDGWFYIVDRLDEPEMYNKTKSYKAGFEAGMNDALADEKGPKHPASYQALRR